MSVNFGQNLKHCDKKNVPFRVFTIRIEYPLKYMKRTTIVHPVAAVLPNNLFFFVFVSLFFFNAIFRYERCQSDIMVPECPNQNRFERSNRIEHLIRTFGQNSVRLTQLSVLFSTNTNLY